LYFSILTRKVRPDWEVTVFERGRPGDAFGFGVVFSDETLTVFEHADPESYSAITERFVRWTDIDIHHRGEVTRSGGHGFSAIGRRELLGILQRRAAELGAELRFEHEAPPLAELGWADAIIGADGVGSAVRAALEHEFTPELEPRHCRYIWLGTDFVWDAFKFFIAETEHGVFQAHAYPYDERMSTFIVETHEDVWSAARLDSGDDDVAFCARLFADGLEGHRLFANNSRWIRFVTVRNRSWHSGNVVLLGDAAHTAHFSIGSGTKLAMEDAAALAWAFATHGEDIAAATAAYEAERRPVVESTQRAAQASLEWFEGFCAAAGTEPRPPMFVPFRLRGLTLPNRVVVSSMDMYSARDGMPSDLHLVHLGARALGGAGLVMTEMICVSDIGRISPGCAGMYRDEHVEAWRRIVSFAHEYGGCAIGAQLGHSGRKGSTKLMWEGIDEPLPDGNWPVIAPSAIPYGPRNQAPRAMTRAAMDLVRDQFVAAARGAIEAGFDLLELHMAHGYLLSSFLSPLANIREDEYGGSLENRARYPLEVFAACRGVWPEERPMSVRISATDWVPGGFDADDAVAFAQMLREHGCDAVDVSTGQVSPLERPTFGRSYQTPFADRIRNEVGIPTIAVGAISSYDDVNMIVLAGRADLCALARPHLYDPHWTLHAAAEQDYDGLRWIPQYRAGSRKPPAGRDRVRPELERTFAPTVLQ
jgi:anthraniloyl-CoA monooxygenase